MTSLMSLLTLLVASSLCCGAQARSAPIPSDLEEPLSVGLRAEQGPGMSDALKYLEELDKYYSQAARPSWRLYRQRRVGNNMASALEKLSQIKNYYNEAGRPRYVRFGKRSGGQTRLPAEILVPTFGRWRK